PTAHTDEIGLFAAKYRFSFADNRQSYESETGRLPAYFFLRRPFLAVRPLRAASALSIANSSSLRPCLMRAVSHRGRAPRPAHVSPPGPRYLGATLRPFSAEPRPNTVREIPAARPLSALRRESCFSSSLRFCLSLLSISARSASTASTSIPFRLIAAIRLSHSWCGSIELFNRKERQARQSGIPCTLSASVFRPGIPAQSVYCGWELRRSTRSSSRAALITFRRR